MGMQPILPITVPVIKIKGATRQHNVDGDVDVTVTLGVNRADYYKLVMIILSTLPTRTITNWGQ